VERLTFRASRKRNRPGQRGQRPRSVPGVGSSAGGSSVGFGQEVDVARAAFDRFAQLRLEIIRRQGEFTGDGRQADVFSRLGARGINSRSRTHRSRHVGELRHRSLLQETGRDATNDETYSISLIESERDVNYKNVIP
jgi:hypothetical protein